MTRGILGKLNERIQFRKRKSILVLRCCSSDPYLEVVKKAKREIRRKSPQGLRGLATKPPPSSTLILANAFICMIKLVVVAEPALKKERTFFSQSEFHRDQIQFLGHVISKGVVINPKKFKEILNCPIPKDVAIIISFMGIIG